MRRIRPEFGALFGPNKSIGAGENIFALDSAPVGISLVPFVRWADGRNLVTSSIRRRFGVRISASWEGSQPVNSVSLGLHKSVGTTNADTSSRSTATSTLLALLIPEQAVDREQSEPTRPLPAKNMQLMTKGEVL